MKKIFLHPALVIMSAVTYVGVIGPALISAESDLAVIAGIAGLLLMAYWGYKTYRAYSVEGNYGLGSKNNNNKDA